MPNHIFKSSIALFALMLGLAGCGDTTNNTTAEYAAPGMPDNVHTTSGDGQATIAWRPASNAVSYNIYWKLSPGVTTTDNVIVNASSPWVHLGLTNNNTCYYRVSAVNSRGESALSPETSARPRALFGMETKLVTSPTETSAWFGAYSSISGDYVIISSPMKDEGGISTAGAAYIYHRTGPDTWDAGTKITAPDVQTEATFGISVSLNGDYAVVGASGNDEGGIANAGAAYIFHRTGPNTWDAGAKITAPDPEADAMFGIAVSISGDYAVAGAYLKDEGGMSNAGAVYIFHRTGPNTWDAGTKITASDPVAMALFGGMVSISGDYAIAAASLKDEGGMSDAGAAYLFHRTGPNTWDSGTKITAPDPEASAYFGVSLSVNGDYAAVGASQKDEGGNANAGAVYLFHRTGPNTWGAGTKITAPDPEANAWFGGALSLSGDYAVVSASGKDEGGKANAGAVYYFSRTGLNTWDAGTKITSSDPEAGASFGSSVSISGNSGVIGAYRKDEGGSTDAGAAYVY